VRDPTPARSIAKSCSRSRERQRQRRAQSEERERESERERERERERESYPPALPPLPKFHIRLGFLLERALSRDRSTPLGDGGGVRSPKCDDGGARAPCV